MNNEEKKQIMHNCLKGLQSLNLILDAIMSKDKSMQDDKLSDTKNEVEERMESLNLLLNKNENLKR